MLEKHIMHPHASRVRFVWGVLLPPIHWDGSPRSSLRRRTIDGRFGRLGRDALGHDPALGLQPYPQKVVRPPKPTPTTFSGGGWSPRAARRKPRKTFTSSNSPPTRWCLVARRASWSPTPLRLGGGWVLERSGRVFFLLLAGGPRDGFRGGMLWHGLGTSKGDGKQHSWVIFHPSSTLQIVFSVEDQYLSTSWMPDLS